MVLSIYLSVSLSIYFTFLHYMLGDELENILSPAMRQLAAAVYSDARPTSLFPWVMTLRSQLEYSGRLRFAASAGNPESSLGNVLMIVWDQQSWSAFCLYWLVGEKKC